MWKYYIYDTIKNRGYHYFLEGRVCDFEETADEISAKVDGTRDYQVRIFKTDFSMEFTGSCNCPFAQSNPNCKHMAAVMYEWENRKRKEELQSFDLKPAKLNRIIRDDESYIAFKILNGIKLNMDDLVFYKELIDDASPNEFASKKFQDILKSDVKNLMKNGDFYAATMIVGELIVASQNFSMSAVLDVNIIKKKCLDLLDKIYEAGDEKCQSLISMMRPQI